MSHYVGVWCLVLLVAFFQSRISHISLLIRRLMSTISRLLSYLHRVSSLDSRLASQMARYCIRVSLVIHIHIFHIVTRVKSVVSDLASSTCRLYFLALVSRVSFLVCHFSCLLSRLSSLVAVA